MKAVDSEFNQSLQNDPWKFFSLTQQEAHKDSPLHRFNCGNLESLKQEGVREALLKFHQTYYSSNIMKLCIVGKQNVDELERIVSDLFKDVPNK